VIDQRVPHPAEAVPLYSHHPRQSLVDDVSPHAVGEWVRRGSAYWPHCSRPRRTRGANIGCYSRTRSCCRRRRSHGESHEPCLLRRTASDRPGHRPVRAAHTRRLRRTPSRGRLECGCPATVATKSIPRSVEGFQAVDGRVERALLREGSDVHLITPRPAMPRPVHPLSVQSKLVMVVNSARLRDTVGLVQRDRGIGIALVLGSSMKERLVGACYRARHSARPPPSSERSHGNRVAV